MVRSCLVSLALGSLAIGSFAQVNILSDVINFRESTNRNKSTMHNGSMDIRGSEGNDALNVQFTGTGSSDRIGIYASSLPAVGYGWGGRFIGGAIGVRGEAGANVNRSAYGGHFSSTTSTSFPAALRAGILGSISGSGSGGWAGYFLGSTFSTGTYQGSDARLKTNIEPLESALAKIMLLRPKTYNYDTAKFSKMGLDETPKIGLLAQDVESVIPGAVRETTLPEELVEEGSKVTSIKAVDYTQLIPLLVKAIQEQQAEIDALKAGRQ